MPTEEVSNSSPIKGSNSSTDVQVVKKDPVRRYRPNIPFLERLIEAWRQQKAAVNMAKEKGAS